MTIICFQWLSFQTGKYRSVEGVIQRLSFRWLSFQAGKYQKGNYHGSYRPFSVVVILSR